MTSGGADIPWRYHPAPALLAVAPRRVVPLGDGLRYRYDTNYRQGGLFPITYQEGGHYVGFGSGAENQAYAYPLVTLPVLRRTATLPGQKQDAGIWMDRVYDEGYISHDPGTRWNLEHLYNQGQYLYDRGQTMYEPGTGENLNAHYEYGYTLHEPGAGDYFWHYR